VVHIPARFCTDWGYRNYNRQRLGMHASLWTDGSCAGFNVSASGYVEFIFLCEIQGFHRGGTLYFPVFGSNLLS
jgi:hypothetical protein